MYGLGATCFLPAGLLLAANGEFIQVHPTCIPGEDKLRLMSGITRGDGGSVWVPKKPGDNRDQKSGFRKTSAGIFWKQRVSRGMAILYRVMLGCAWAIFKVVYEHNLGIDGKPMVYLDLTHIDRKILDRKLEGTLEIYEKFVGDDPRDTPMKIFPGMHYTMGAVGGFQAGYEYSRRGTGPRASASISTMARIGWARTRWYRLLVYGGIAGPNAVERARGLQALPDSNGAEDAEKKKQEESTSLLMNNQGTENPFRLWREL